MYEIPFKRLMFLLLAASVVGNFGQILKCVLLVPGMNTRQFPISLFLDPANPLATLR